MTLDELIQAAMNEIGVPQPGYPAPVANAYEHLEAARAIIAKGRIRATIIWQNGDCWREQDCFCIPVGDARHHGPGGGQLGNATSIPLDEEALDA